MLLCKKYQNFCGRDTIDPLAPYVDPDTGIPDDDPEVMECLEEYVRLQNADHDYEWEVNMNEVPVEFWKNSRERTKDIADREEKIGKEAQLEYEVKDVWQNFFEVLTYFDRGDSFYEELQADYTKADTVLEERLNIAERAKKRTNGPKTEDRDIPPKWWPREDMSLVTLEEKDKLSTLFVTRKVFLQAGIDCKHVLSSEKPSTAEVQSFWKEMVKRQIHLNEQKAEEPYLQVLTSINNRNGKVAHVVTHPKEEKLNIESDGDVKCYSTDVRKPSAEKPPEKLHRRIMQIIKEEIQGGVVKPQFRRYLKKARLGKKKCWVVKPIREIQDMLLQEQEFVYSSGDDFENHVVNCSSDEEERANPFWESDRKEAEGYLHAPDWFPTERRHEEFQEILERTEKPELFEDTVNKEDMYHMEHAARREARKKNILAQKKRLERMSALSIKHEVPPRDIKREELGAEGGPKRTGDCVMVPTKKIKLCATPSRKGSLLKKEEFYKDVEVYAEDEEISVNRRVQALSVMQRSIKKLMRSVIALGVICNRP